MGQPWADGVCRSRRPPIRRSPESPSLTLSRNGFTKISFCPSCTTESPQPTRERAIRRSSTTWLIRQAPHRHSMRSESNRQSPDQTRARPSINPAPETNLRPRWRTSSFAGGRAITGRSSRARGRTSSSPAAGAIIQLELPDDAGAQRPNSSSRATGPLQLELQDDAGARRRTSSSLAAGPLQDEASRARWLTKL